VKFQDAAKQIVAPAVTRDSGQIRVVLYAYHRIGGKFVRWTVELEPKFSAKSDKLGQFGGTSYR